MSEPKPFASLSSGLLARKGAAKPAMRPQGFGQLGTGLEDLGWNDMGHGASAPAEPSAGFRDDVREHLPSSITALTPAPRSHDKHVEQDAEPEQADFEAPPESPVVEQQRTIAASFATVPVKEATEVDTPKVAKVARVAEAVAGDAPRSAVVALPRRPRQAAGLKSKAAFTLRLDPERHLKLRLACAVKHRSAQQIVSEALDEYLNSVPELEALAQQLPARKRN